jgi:hypothetical protein
MGGNETVSSTVTPKKAGAPSIRALRNRWSAASEPETNSFRPVSDQSSPTASASCWDARK